MTGVRLFAGTRQGPFVLESDADRGDWTVCEPALAGWEVTDGCVDGRPGRDGDARLLAGVGRFVYGPTVHRSDAGDTWATVDCHLPRVNSVNATAVE